MHKLLAEKNRLVEMGPQGDKGVRQNISNYLPQHPQTLMGNCFPVLAS